MMSSLGYHALEYYFRYRHRIFESLHTGRLKDFEKRYCPQWIKTYLLDKKLNSIKSFPENILIETTNICNAKCWFCPQPNITRKAGNMEFDLYKKIIDEIQLNKKYVKNIQLYLDGDPVLDKKLLKRLRYAHSKKVNKMHLSSNMQYFSPKLTDELFESNLGDTLLYVICSLDGVSPETHRQNRINVDFDIAVENTEYLISAKKKHRANYPWIFTRLLQNELTRKEGRQFVERWRNRADKVLVAKMHNWGGQIDDANLLALDNTTPGACYLPFSQFSIQSNGITRMCCIDANGTVVTGDLRNQSIKEVWNGFTENEIRKNHLSGDLDSLPEICTDCTMPSKGQWNAPFYWT